MSDEQESTEPQPSELEREERRLERLRLVVTPWPSPHFEDDGPPPPTAA